MDSWLDAVGNLRQRKIVQWTLAYVAIAWLSLEAFDLVAEQFLWPYWVRQGATVLVVAGLVTTLVLAWQHGERGRQRAGLGELLLLAFVAALSVATIWMLRERSERLGIDSPRQDTQFTLRSTPPPENSIAVLPCRSAGTGQRDAPFADALAAELITRLSTVRDLKVPSQTSSFSFRGRDVSLEEVASSLRVRHVLECTVTGEASRMYVTARLVDGHTGYTLWADTYDSEEAGLIDLQRDVARSVVGGLRLELSGRESARMVRRWTSDPEAYDHFLRGIQLQMGAPTLDNLDAATRHLERAVTLDPEFGRAHARLAINWIIVGNRRLTAPSEAYEKARSYARKALELDAELFEAHWALGWVVLAYELDWQRARAIFQRTIDLAPGEFAGYHSLAYVEGVLGRIDAALEAEEIAVDLDPLAFYPRWGLQMLHERRREYDIAVRIWEALLDITGPEPDFLTEYLVLLARADRREEARNRLAEAGPTTEWEPGNRLGVAVLHAVLGDYDAASAIVDSIESGGTDEELGAMAGELAAAHAELGHRDEALEWLEEARRRHSMWMLHLDLAHFDSLREDARFATLIRELRLPEQHYLTVPPASTARSTASTNEDRYMGLVSSQ